MPTRRIRPGFVAFLTTLLLAIGGPALADDAPKPPEPASDLPRDLIAARQANARAQHEGRPSVWFFASPSAAETTRADARE